jgi:uncharacterized glyoxalase superfamily protein PhnB
MAITPYLYYEDVDAALAWLSKAFGFRLAGRRMKAPDGNTHHAAMRLGDGMVMMGRPSGTYRNPRRLGQATQSLYVNAEDVDAHCARARKAGAKIIEEPKDARYGDRRYGAEDPEGHQWYFAETPKRRPRAPIRRRTRP